MLPDREYLYREEIVHKLSVLNYLVRNREVQEQVALHIDGDGRQDLKGQPHEIFKACK